MKEEKKSGEAEPTISDVMVAIQDLTEAVQVGFARHESILTTLTEGQDQIREDIHILDQRLSKTQNRIEDVVDENQDSISDHERRITALEKAVA